MSSTKDKVLLGLPIFLAALNMRAGINLISPLVPILKNDLNLNNFEISILADIPIFCFAGSSLLMSWISRLGSSNRIIRWAITFLAFGLLARATTGVVGLFAFSIVIGISIAVMNYEIPAWVKEHASRDTGFMTGVYVTLMGICAGLSIAISVPLAHLNSWSWRMAMVPWILISLIAALYWNLRTDRTKIRPESPQISFWRTKTFKNPSAWALGFFFGLQSLTFYATATWLPTILTIKGFTLSGGAVAISICGVLGSLVGLAVPHYIGKVADKRRILATVSFAIALGFLMLIIQSGSILWLWLLVTNIGMSINFPVALMLAGTKSSSPEATRNLSTMMQAIGYSLAAFGPTIVGSIYDISQSWDWALSGVVFICMMQLVTGWIVGKPTLID